jgi:hypothetical protein
MRPHRSDRPAVAPADSESLAGLRVPYDRDDGGHRVADRHMLPEPHHGPAGVRERRVGGAVPLDVLRELGRPVPFVVLRLGAVFRARVPETAINEHRDLPGGERYVRANPA